MKHQVQDKKNRSSSESYSLNLLDLLSLLAGYIIHKLDLQRLLFISSFLTFGVGDGVTAAYLMKKENVMRESNPIIRYMFITGGGNSVISVKIWFTFIILFFVWLFKSKDSYWTINGFLFSLLVGGLMATGANLMAIRGMTPPSPGSIIFVYLFLVVLLVILGDAMDKMSSDRSRKSQAI